MCEHEKTLDVLLYRQDSEGHPLLVKGIVCLSCLEEIEENSLD